MKTAIVAALAFLLSFAESTVCENSDQEERAIALVGGTLIDVSNSGHSTHDIPNAVVVLRAGKIAAAGPATLVKAPIHARTIDCRGTYILPGLVDGFAGLNSQAQANTWLYMGVTTIIGIQDDRRGMLKLDAHPSPHIYPIDLAGTIDSDSLLMSLPQWRNKLKNSGKPKLSLRTFRVRVREQLTWDGISLLPRQSSSFQSATASGSLLMASSPPRLTLMLSTMAWTHMTRYELGLIPSRLQEPLVRDPGGSALESAYSYLRRLDSADPSITAYGSEIKASGAALMPTLSLSYLLLPNHRNLWQEPAASILDPKGLHQPPDPFTGEARFALDDARHLKMTDHAHFWAINRTLPAAHPLYLAGSGASAFGTMPGISMHTELELLVRSGLTPREAMAAATSNYSEKFGWHELGLMEAGRRADLLILEADPTADISNTRKIHSVILGGVVPRCLTYPDRQIARRRSPDESLRMDCNRAWAFLEKPSGRMLVEHSSAEGMVGNPSPTGLRKVCPSFSRTVGQPKGSFQALT